MARIRIPAVIFLSALALLGGCASYTTPGGPVDLGGIQSADIRELMSRQPAASFPALVSVARVQSPHYRSQTATTYGTGAYSVVLTREFMLDRELEEISGWTGIRAVSPITRLLLPNRLDSIDDLRTSGARLKSDILIVFTVDTSFRIDGKSIGPLSVVSLGLLRDRETVVTTTASALFVDVRSGFVYGTAEASASEKQQTNAWSSGSAVDQSRIATERKAFSGLMEEMARAWRGIVAEHTDAA